MFRSHSFNWNMDVLGGFPGDSVVKESACQCRRHGFVPGVGKIPRRRAWQPTLVFLPGESQGQRSLAGYSPWGHKGSDTVCWLNNNWMYLLCLQVKFMMKKIQMASNRERIDKFAGNYYFPLRPYWIASRGDYIPSLNPYLLSELCPYYEKWLPF